MGYNENINIDNKKKQKKSYKKSYKKFVSNKFYNLQK